MGKYNQFKGEMQKAKKKRKEKKKIGTLNL